MKKLPHDNAHTHVTGKSEYVDDRIILKNELFCDVIYSTKPHTKIKSINFLKQIIVGNHNTSCRPQGIEAIYLQ